MRVIQNGLVQQLKKYIIHQMAGSALIRASRAVLIHWNPQGLNRKQLQQYNQQPTERGHICWENTFWIFEWLVGGFNPIETY